jgi:hypothetical protein
MPLDEDILTQLGKSQWYFTLDFQFGFWQIKMVSEDIRNLSMLIMKSGLFDRTIMSFGMRNIINTFLKTMIEVFEIYFEFFFKVFMDD